MRIWSILFLSIFGVVPLNLAHGKDNSPNSNYRFYGDVVSVDPAGRTLTIKSGGKKLVFQINDQTKISGRYERVSLDKIRPGDGATVTMKLGPGNVGIATSIRFDTVGGSRSSFLKLVAARTIDGQTISGLAVENYIEFWPPSDGWSGGNGSWEKDSLDGVFLLEVLPNGTVSEVKMIKSLGYNDLNLRAIKWFKKWRFKPNSVKEVQLPMNYTQYRRGW